MARNRYEYELEINSDVRGLEQAERQVDELARALEGTGDSARDALTVLNAMADDLEDELRAVASTADALKAALGDAFDGDSARVERYIADLRAMGVELDEIEANAKEFADVMERTDQIKLDAANLGLTSVDQSVEGLSDSARGANSALANMVGNSAQDLGELGGIAGSAGVAIGQMAEYAADARFAGESLGSSLASMARVAGPIALIGGSVFAISEGFGLVSEHLEASDRRVSALRGNMEGLNVEAGELLATLQENAEALVLPEDVTVSWDDYVDVLQEIVHLGDGLDEINVAEVLDKANVSLSAFARTASMDLQDVGLAKFMELLQDAMEAGLITTEEYDAALRVFVRTQEDVADAEREAANEARILASSLEDINSLMAAGAEATAAEAEAWNILVQDMADGTLEAHNAASAWNLLRDEFGYTDEAIEEMLRQKVADKVAEDAAAAEEAADAWEQHRKEIEEQEQALAELQGALDDVGRSLGDIADRGDVFARVLDQRNFQLAESTEIIEFSDGLDTLAEAMKDLEESWPDDGTFPGLDLIPDTWNEVRNMPEELRPVIAALEQFGQSVETEMAQAFDTGGASGVREWAENTRTAIENSLRGAGIESQRQIDQILSALGLLPEQVDVAIQVSNEERARNVIAGMESAIANLPTEVQLQIAAVADQDPIAALELAIGALEDAGVEVPVQLVALVDEFNGEIAEVTEGEHVAEVEVVTNADAAADELDEAADDRTSRFEIDLWNIIVQNALLNKVAEDRTAKITAEAHTFNAGLALDDVALPRSAPIDAFLRNLPSRQDIVNRITGGLGYIRIPVDTYARNIARIEGARPR